MCSLLLHANGGRCLGGGARCAWGQELVLSSARRRKSGSHRGFLGFGEVRTPPDTHALGCNVQDIK